MRASRAGGSASLAACCPCAASGSAQARSAAGMTAGIRRAVRTMTSPVRIDDLCCRILRYCTTLMHDSRLMHDARLMHDPWRRQRPLDQLEAQRAPAEVRLRRRHGIDIRGAVVHLITDVFERPD